MDQNSSNDTEKRNWRERLGIGGKELPRLSGEFSKAPETIPAEAAEVRLAQPVAKPAPMAPRVPMKAGAHRLPPGRSSKCRRRALHHRRLMSWPRSFAPSVLPRRNWRNSGSRRQNSGPRMLLYEAPAIVPIKLTRLPQQSRNSVSPMMKPNQTSIATPVPCRRAGHRKGQSRSSHSFRRHGLRWVDSPGFRRVRRPGFQPQYRPQPPRGYSPSAYMPPPPLQQPQRSFNGSLSQPPAGEPRLQAPRTNPDAFRRGPGRSRLRRGRLRKLRSVPCSSGPAPCAPRPMTRTTATRFLRTLQPRSSRRASATDYNQAYRETEGAYGEERRRSSGPWLLLLFLMLAAGAAGAGVWYYQTKVKTVATNGASDTAPVVSAPEQSAKSAPEQPLDGQSDSAGSATSKKQIYDRIIGDNEVLGGQVVPTEETPIQPESQQGDAEQIPQPAGGLIPSRKAVKLFHCPCPRRQERTMTRKGRFPRRRPTRRWL